MCFDSVFCDFVISNNYEMSIEPTARRALRGKTGDADFKGISVCFGRPEMACFWGQKFDIFECHFESEIGRDILAKK